MRIASALLSSRKVWVALTALAGIVLVQLGMDAGKAQKITEGIEAVASAIILAIGIEDHGKNDSGNSGDAPGPQTGKVG